MPRPCKRRRICAMPGCARFGPIRPENGTLPPIAMTVDEFECIRLIDGNDMTQEECAEQMQVARTTAQLIYNSARKKLADCLVNGRELVIEGGAFVLCERRGGCAHGCRGRCHQSESKTEEIET